MPLDNNTVDKNRRIDPESWLSRSALPLTQDQVSAIHDATIEVLSETGFHFVCKQVQGIFQENGFRLENERIYFTEKQILKALETVPKSCTIRARNPAKDICMQQGNASFGLGRGAIYMVDPDGLHRHAVKDDITASYKLAQSMDVLEHSGPLAYPSDVDKTNVHLWQTQSAIRYTDKAYNLINRHDIDLVALAHATNRKEMAERSDFNRSPGHGTCNIQSPLTVSYEDCENLKEYTRLGIAFNVASMPVAGTSGPCTIAGTIVLQNAENLAPIVFSQLVRPGCPVIYGAIGGVADMKTLKPRFGTSEARIIERAGCQMAQSYGLLSRVSTSLTDAPAHDFQSGAQSMLGTLSVIQGSANFLTGCGLLGSYMGASIAKIILDAELVTMAHRYLSSIGSDADAMAVDVIGEVGPGSHFIDHPHTLENYRSEFAIDSLFKSPVYETGDEISTRDIVYAANEKARRLIDSYEMPPMDPGMREQLDEYVKANWADN